MSEPAFVDHLGCRLAYGVRGDGPPVLFVQGTGVHGEGWSPQVDALSGRWRCAWFDNRGMGRSQPLAGTLTVGAMAEDARAVMDALGWTSAHVVGHSLGGPIALELALRHRDRVRSLSLLCTFARGADVTRLTPWLVWMGLRTALGTRRMRRRAFLEMVVPPDALRGQDLDALAERLEPVFGHDLAVQPPVAMKQLGALGAYDATPRLAELAGVPTLVVSAEHDRIARPELGEQLAHAIPGARYELLEGAGHGVPIADPGRVNELLEAHLSAAQRAS